MRMSLHKKSEGFSLVEILIALTIVAVMATVGFALLKYRDRAKMMKTKNELQALKLTIDTYNTDTGMYPVTLQDLMTRPADQKISKRWEGPYLDKEVEDGWKHSYAYQLNPKGSRQPYELYSWGPNGEGSPAEEHISVWDV